MTLGRAYWRLLVLLLLVGLVGAACASPQGEAPTGETAAEGEAPAEEAAQAGEVVFFSTQLAPIEEAEKVRNAILPDFTGQVEFIGAENYAAWADRVTAEAEAGEGSIDLLGGLHGDFVSAGTDLLTDVSDLMGELSDRGFSEQYTELATLGTDSTFYVPWMQGTYIMAANQKALEHLPEGADVEALTYEQYLEWAGNIAEATGQNKVGFPAGEGGLMHRFFQGYLIPSFTGGLVTTFTESEPAWQWLSDIWQYTHPQSVSYEFMQEPLLSEEVWVAWDHVARLIDALEARPDDFVAFPAPTGPEGQAFMPVLAGLAIPNTAPNPEGAAELIRYLTEPETQFTTLREVAFFPVVDAELPADLSPGVSAEAEAVQQQTEAPEALPSLLPIGLGELSGDFNKVFTDSFQQIILQEAEIASVLEQQAQALESVMQETGAPCWEPDPPSEGEPCPVQ